MSRSMIAAVTAAAIVWSPSAFAQDAAAPAAAPAAAAAPKTIRIKEGTELPVRFEEKLSSATATMGDRFSIGLSDDVPLGDGVMLRDGYRGVGEVTAADKRGFIGKAGELNVRLNYLRVGDQRIPLRASRGQEGKSGLGATVALTVLFGPLGLLKRGKDIEVQKGQEMTAFVDQDVDLVLPLAAAPSPD